MATRPITPGRRRGIDPVQVYRAAQRITGVFRVPARLGLAATRDLVDAEPASLALGVSNSRGLRRPPMVRLDGVPARVEPGTRQTWLEQGFSAGAGPVLAAQAKRVPFEIEIELVGTDRLTFVPVGASTHAEVESDWRHPSFTGGFLPDERSVTNQGFRATWRLSRYATGVDALIEGRRMRARLALGTSDFGVRFVTPVDVYQQSTRAVKYGMLFVILTFAGFFLFEVLKRMAVHPIQYGMAGAAIAMFFLLLISLSEHIAFALAYLAASAGCVGLLAFYVGHVLRSTARGLGFGGLLAGPLRGALRAPPVGGLRAAAGLAAAVRAARRGDGHDPARGLVSGRRAHRELVARHPDRDRSVGAAPPRRHDSMGVPGPGYIGGIGANTKRTAQTTMMTAATITA